MTSREHPIGDDDLNGWVDGRLTAERRLAVEAYLAAHPAAAASVAADAELRALLRARLAAKGDEPTPSRLRIANILAERRRLARRRFGAVAAAFALLLTGAAAGWLGHGAIGGPKPDGAGTTREAITAYRTFVVETAHPVEVRADHEAHLVQWLSKRLGRPLVAHNLLAQGYELVGGRLLPASQGPAAMFMYADRAGGRMTLYARSDAADTMAGFRFEQDADVSAFAWIDRDLAYVVSARTDRAQLLTIAEAIHGQLTRPAADRL